jgi:hypothetical protein
MPPVHTWAAVNVPSPIRSEPVGQDGLTSIVIGVLNRHPCKGHLYAILYRAPLPVNTPSN